MDLSRQSSLQPWYFQSPIQIINRPGPAQLSMISQGWLNATTCGTFKKNTQFSSSTHQKQFSIVYIMQDLNLCRFETKESSSLKKSFPNGENKISPFYVRFYFENNSIFIQNCITSNPTCFDGGLFKLPIVSLPQQ